MGLFLFEFWDSETEEYFYYLIESKELEKLDGFELEELKGRIQKAYNEADTELEFADFDEVYDWLDQNIRKFIPDAKPLDFTRV